MILAIDPGPEQSGYYLGNPLHEIEPIRDHGHILNSDLKHCIEHGILHLAEHVVIEDFEPWNTRTGHNVVETCRWIGRFQEACWQYWGQEPTLFRRREVCRFLVGDGQARKSAVRAFCIDRYGPDQQKAIGTKKHGRGPLYGLVVHEFDALALAIAYAEGLTPKG